MSFILDPYIAFLFGIIVSFFTKRFNFSRKSIIITSAAVMIPSTSDSILLYLNIVKDETIGLGTFSYFIPIEKQIGPRIMLHSNVTGATTDHFPILVAAIFYALYFLWFYLGFKSARNMVKPLEPTPRENANRALYIKIGGLLIFASAGLMFVFFTMVPLDEVIIGDSFGAKSSQQDAEAAVIGYMASSSAEFQSFSDNLCNPDKIGIEQDPPLLVNKNSNIELVHSYLPAVSIEHLQEMCHARQIIGENIVFVFDNISTWMFIIGIFMVTTPRVIKNQFWDYEGKEKEENGML